MNIETEIVKYLSINNINFMLNNSKVEINQYLTDKQIEELSIITPEIEWNYNPKPKQI